MSLNNKKMAFSAYSESLKRNWTLVALGQRSSSIGPSLSKEIGRMESDQSTVSNSNSLVPRCEVVTYIEPPPSPDQMPCRASSNIESRIRVD